jgi:uncharacterized membrane protein YfcA
MEIYLPIAEISVNWAMILGMGAAVGFISGVFGLGGGFLMTPMLVFYGVPPAIAVGTEAPVIAAASVSGALTRYRSGNIDIKMGTVMLVGGLLGSVAGVQIFSFLQTLGQIDFVVTAGYVVLLSAIGMLMLNESIRVIIAARRGTAQAAAKHTPHNWVHGLPLRARFRRSKLYISVIPPALLGLTVGILAAILGVGGGFLMIPAMIYMLKMPTDVVVGTSQFQILFVTAATTVLHAATNQTVDLTLAVLLIVGGVAGVQWGVRVSSRLRGEELRALLGILVVLVAGRLLVELVTSPDDIYSIVVGAP